MGRLPSLNLSREGVAGTSAAVALGSTEEAAPAPVLAPVPMPAFAAGGSELRAAAATAAAIAMAVASSPMSVAESSKVSPNFPLGAAPARGDAPSNSLGSRSSEISLAPLWPDTSKTSLLLLCSTPLLEESEASRRLLCAETAPGLASTAAEDDDASPSSTLSASSLSSSCSRVPTLAAAGVCAGVTLGPVVAEDVGAVFDVKEGFARPTPALPRSAAGDATPPARAAAAAAAVVAAGSSAAACTTMLGILLAPLLMIVDGPAPTPVALAALVVLLLLLVPVAGWMVELVGMTMRGPPAPLSASAPAMSARPPAAASPPLPAATSPPEAGCWPTLCPFTSREVEVEFVVALEVEVATAVSTADVDDAEPPLEGAFPEGIAELPGPLLGAAPTSAMFFFFPSE
mmetsp:Transcript_57377/g.125667  ORF Transcript_57377/g.125667 Transcript_57377/m.125667 type:complete len:402 (+) Transcript_57377:395-1600(+)